MEGFTDKKRYLDAAHAFREAAITDGWDANPTYKTEDISRACKLKKDGYTMLIISRDNSEEGLKFKYEAGVHIWGPDRLAISVPNSYSMSKIIDGLKKCLQCGDISEDVKRAGFAGRYCPKCLPGQKKAQEYPGWTN